MRDTESMDIIRMLIGKRSEIRVFDSRGYSEFSMRMGDVSDHCTHCAIEYEVMAGADAIVIVTEWNQFRILDLIPAKSIMCGEVFVDLRNVYPSSE